MIKAQETAQSICDEIQEIMKTYREQEERGNVDTPGGLEHMGDVWRLLSEWDLQISASREPTLASDPRMTPGDFDALHKIARGDP